MEYLGKRSLLTALHRNSQERKWDSRLNLTSFILPKAVLSWEAVM
jgi:hypothetical protein